ncbi:MAG: hypothetical protein KDA68_11850, partial [Planctomycetaceae bacterium]|nr:hypothetical protein [Planctomycetaceae bacterium]
MTVVPAVPCDLSVSIIPVDPSLCNICDGRVDESNKKTPQERRLRTSNVVQSKGDYSFMIS